MVKSMRQALYKLEVGERGLDPHLTPWPVMANSVCLHSFVTKKNREICANPEDKWVQGYIKDPNLPLLPPRNLAPVITIRSVKG